MDRKKELEKLGKRIREIRMEKGMSQTDLAHAINKDQPSIQRVEGGKINPSYLYLKEIAAGLGVKMKELTDD